MITWLGLKPLSVQGDAGVGRKVWLAANLQPEQTILDVGGTGTMFEGWHDMEKVDAFDDLSGFGPNCGHHLACKRFFPSDVGKLGNTYLYRRENFHYDVVALCEVLEHIGDPVQAIAAASVIGTRVLITTPFENRWNNPAQYRVAGHIRFFTPDTFCARLREANVHAAVGLLEFAGWSFLTAVVSQKDEHVQDLLQV